MRRWLREPLLHFVVLGVALLTVEHRLAPPAHRIVVPAEVVRGLREDHLRRTATLPAPAEEAALVERWVDDEILVREALALGLDRGDVIVRRRLVQKMEFLAEDAAPVPVPTDAALTDYLARHAERYATPARVSLTQVWAGPGADSGTVVRLRAALAAGADPAAAGAPFVGGRTFTLRSERELAAVFGPAFAAAVMAAPAGAWSGPVRSSYGLHLVRVSEQRAGGPPVLDEVRAAATRDWEEEQRAARVRAAHERLRAGWTVEVEDAGEAGSARAAR